MTYTLKQSIHALFAGGLLAMAAPAVHADITWNYANLSSSCVGTSGVTSSDCNQGTNVVDLEMSAWSTSLNNTNTNVFRTAGLYDYGTSAGIGIIAQGESTGTGPHAVDNVYGTDAVLLSFSDTVTLTDFTIGWNGTDNGDAPTGYRDSDVSILAYTGSTAPTLSGASLSNASASYLMSNGWSLIGHYADVGSGSNFQAVTTNVSSSWWLVSAYNSVYSGSSAPVSSNGGYLGNSNDSFKILAVAGTKTTPPPPPNQTPEPGALALAGLGLVGMMAVRRRRNPA